MLPVRAFFNYVVSDAEQDLDKLRIEHEEEANSEDDALFVNTWIPSNLHQISDLQDIERDMDRIQVSFCLF